MCAFIELGFKNGTLLLRRKLLFFTFLSPINMCKRLEEFTAAELVERRMVQNLLHSAMLELKQALDNQDYTQATMHNLIGIRLLDSMIQHHIALDDELEILDTLRINVQSILRLQHRWQ
jgi:hypothetical protein